MNVTLVAKEKLEETLENEQAEPDMVVRLLLLQSRSGKFDKALDKVK